MFEGTPPFTVKWFKDNIKLFSSPSCVIKTNSSSSTIILHSVGALQIAIYSCQVTNQAGTEKCAAELIVKGWTFLFCPPPLN
jgi:titin